MRRKAALLMTLAERVHFVSFKSLLTPQELSTDWVVLICHLDSNFYLSDNLLERCGGGGGRGTAVKTFLECLPCCTITAQESVLIWDADRWLDGQA